ncbi:MAG: E3 ubiquitin ligase family protein [Actinomycetia bacterium]|nr:E3 ubiquitin ligase family protein [Actinomycetes bacterium]
MMPFIIGGILIIGGAALSFFVPRKIKDRNIEIKFMQTIPIKELKAILKDNAAAGLDGYRHYVELKGSADSDNPEKAPFSEKEVAYYNADLYRVHEEKHTYKDDKGTHQQIIKKETLVSNQKSSGSVVLKDSQSGEKVYIDVSQSGLKLDALKTLDRFESENSVKKYNFLSNLQYNNRGARTLGFRMIEKTIPMGQSLYVLGEAWLEGLKVKIGRPREEKKPFIVSVRSEADIVQANINSARIALAIGIMIAIAGVFVMIFMK